MSRASLKWVEDSSGWNLIETLPEDNFRIWGHLGRFGTGSELSGSAHGVPEGCIRAVPLEAFRGDDPQKLRDRIKRAAMRHYLSHRDAS